MNGAMWDVEIIEEPGFTSDISSVYCNESDMTFSEDTQFESFKIEEKDKKETHCFFVPEHGTANNAIIVIKHPTSLAFTGKLNIKVLWGALDIYGKTMTANQNRFYQLLSPISNSLLNLKTLALEDTKMTDSKHVFEVLIQHQWHHKDAVNVMKSVDYDTVGILFQDLETDSTKHLEKFYPNLFLSNCCVRGVPSIDLPTSFKCQLFDPTTVKSIYCEDWYSILQDIENDLPQARILICGGKNVGKSTLFRFLVNSCIDKCNKVCCLDLDPGQSEFTPPGLISLLTVSEPCLSPGFANRRKPKKGIFIGDLTPADHPLHYILSIKDLLSLYNSKYNSLPLLVNTMGWNRGIGLSLLADIIHLIQPTHIIQIDCKAFPPRNFPKLSLENVKKMVGWNYGSPAIPPYKHIIKQSTVDLMSFQFESKKFREINLLSYFCSFQNMLDDWQPFNRLPPYKIKWSSVALHVMNGVQDNRDILYFYNASLVALCQCDVGEILSTSDPDLPKLLSKMPVCNCLGYGIVRGISMEEKCFYIISLLSPESMKKVNALIKGSVLAPLKLMMQQDFQSIEIEDEREKIWAPYVGSRKMAKASHRMGGKCVPSRTFKMKR